MVEIVKLRRNPKRKWKKVERPPSASNGHPLRARLRIRQWPTNKQPKHEREEHVEGVLKGEQVCAPLNPPNSSYSLSCEYETDKRLTRIEYYYTNDGEFVQAVKKI
jgi:hypothetical protein